MSEAALLRKLRLLEERLEAAPSSGPAAGADSSLRKELRELRERRLRGEIDDAALERGQRDALERAGR